MVYSHVKSSSKTQSVLQLLRQYESRNVTHIDSAGDWPIVWERARGTHVWDCEGKKYLDLTAAFGVATAGHANPKVVKAGQQQMTRLLHAMGDVHPHALKAELARELSRITFERWTSYRGKTIFCSSGFEAVEAALKTAFLSTGKNKVIAFEGAYHGLGYGALNATHREHFRSPFRRQLREFAHFVPFPSKKEELAGLEREMQNLFRREKMGAVVVEPIQARGGINVPPTGFLPLLRRLCDRNNALLIVDEIYTGFGRTGKWFACEHSKTVPDLVCLGKGLTGGFPLSACVGSAELMDAAWPESSGEAIHTSTFLGHPVGCAMALANIREIKRLDLCERSAARGAFLMSELRKRVRGRNVEVRGLGLMVGVELLDHAGGPDTTRSLEAIKHLLKQGFIFLPEGEFANIIGFTPPLIISERELLNAIEALTDTLSL